MTHSRMVSRLASKVAVVGKRCQNFHPSLERTCFFKSFSTSGTRNTEMHQSLSSLHNIGARERMVSLQNENVAPYPRAKGVRDTLSCQRFNKTYQSVHAKEDFENSQSITLQGRVNAIRKAGSRLVFVDIIQDGHRVQGICSLSKLTVSETGRDAFRKTFQVLRRGDLIRLQGFPTRSDSGELSLSLNSLPELLAPCLPDLPTKVEDPETRIRLRHLDQLVNTQIPALIRLRSEVIRFIRRFLLQKDYLEVQTPILAASSGGAIARPFGTVATEFADRSISLRIAPELWLKRLIIGGFDRVFEIGPSFRNEGIDLTHNPEFTTCEFYQAFATLEDLIEMTEKMLAGIAVHLKKELSINSANLSPGAISFNGPYKRIDFITHIENAIRMRLPDLVNPDAPGLIRQILKDNEVEAFETDTLPQMLDRLSASFIEPSCIEPTFIVHHPECLSPLAKSFTHPENGQIVSARAELFVRGQELINTYEEENSPFEQRRKFQEQLLLKPDAEAGQLDEAYLEALEWGLPPTGGWGGGIERLCMMMAGTNRIGDVLAFGTLRNVVALGHRRMPHC